MLDHRERPSENSDTPVLLLEIARGSTRHPVRPVLGDRFLIGASAACDLRLGGHAIPPLHSLIVREADGRFRWERVSAAGDFLWNGQPVESQLLDDGDRVQIASMEFVVRLKPGLKIQPVVPAESRLTGDATPAEEGFEMSAAAIADRLEADWELVDRFDSRRQLGVETLVAAIAAHANQTGEYSYETPAGHNALRRELERLAEQIESFAGRLDGTTDSATEDGPAIAESMARVRDAERRLNGRIASLLHPVHPDATAAKSLENLHAA